MANPVRFTFVNWNTKDYHSIFRVGQYAVQFSNFYGVGKDISIKDLDTQNTLRTYKFTANESILNFKFPYLVSRIDNLIKIWDVNADTENPVNHIQTELSGIHRGDINQNMLLILSKENMAPKYLTVIEDIENIDKKSASTRIQWNGLDFETGLMIHDDKIFVSLHLGARVHGMSLLDHNKTKIIDAVEDPITYLEKMTPDKREEYEANIIRSFAAEGERVAGSTKKTIRVWNLQSCALLHQFPVDDVCHLYSLEGNHLFGTEGRMIKIWDITNGRVIFNAENLSSHPIPHCTLYKGQIFHLNSVEFAPTIGG